MIANESHSFDLAWFNQTPRLDLLQKGSLRRILNLSAQLSDDWSGMLGRSTMQEDFGSLRFQLAYMAYALGLTHVHRLPAAPAMFREPFDRLIQKTLSPDVWSYWHYVSTGNGPFNGSQGVLPSRWNPVDTDNIMYSAYVQSMALMYHYLFRDAKYASEGALTFAVVSLFWGGDDKRFPYDERSLNQHLYWNMVERGYLGIACEPNCVFQICNQPAIFGFRFHDLVYGGDTASEVTSGYLKAWSEFGILDEAGHFNMLVQEKERIALANPNSPWVDLWVMTLMHAWNPQFIEQQYPTLIKSWLQNGPNDTLWVSPPYIGPGLEAIPVAHNQGWAAACAAEMGDSERLKKLLAYADEYLHPTWSDGGYHYQRCDEGFDADGRFITMDPHTSNALLPLARLNVPGGIHKLYEGPWGDAHFKEPAVTSLSAGTSLCRAWFDTQRNSLALTVDSSTRTDVRRLEISNALGRGVYHLSSQGEKCEVFEQHENGLLCIELTGCKETDLILEWE
ncbi:hypothetical protein G3O06_32135 [Burkholderia sp. Ac-20345]|uniref:linalool dehydratase/isomerase domain-containing protein n=1 Tax=Burkholderia sp. Ac-20345 TaxID=2703891 RepID=UPI00197C0B9A|nr:hypothetical protein [Burkholderia sp. Ac-20345]MBN3782152.1 hypothetical protein [Burkholderia sp. Ac-20345]